MALDVYKDWLGIPEEQRPPNHYQLLRLVSFEDDAPKINAHYKQLNGHVRKYATGRYAVESQELLNELAKAMLCLTDAVRKREYDESLGRVFDMPDDPTGRQPMELVLVAQGHLAREQVREVREFAERRGLSIRDAVVQMKLVDAETAGLALAEQLGLAFVDLDETVPDDSVLDRVPRSLVRQHTILPLFVDEDVLLVACPDDPDPDLEDELRLRFEVPIRRVIATPLAINQGIAKYFAAGLRDEAPALPTAVKPRRRKAHQKQAGVPKPAKRAGPISDDQRRQRKQLGIILICWGFVIPAMIGWWAIDSANLLTQLLPAFLVGSAVALWVVRVYWRK